MTSRQLLVFIAAYLSLAGCSAGYGAARQSGTISPLDYGLAKARTGEERYKVLYETHTRALSSGLCVSYEGITSIDLVVPQGAKSIPLTSENDFSNVVFNVLNNQVDLFLFSFVQKSQTISVSKSEIDQGVFRGNAVLSKGRHLLSISDKKPWVENRSGYNYGHTRKDILLVENGSAANKPIMPYNNSDSQPSCQVYSLPNSKISFANVTLNRVAGSSKKTYLCNIVGCDNLSLVNVRINTPKSSLTSDTAIRIVDCTNVSFKDVIINGTYSQTNHSGYGVSLNNVWNFYALRMSGRGNWGVFGNNNINTALLEKCELNRFDVHCYGRDIAFQNSNFFDCYNQFSSVFGEISFKNCEFTSFVPVLYERSYNAYVGHDVSFVDCTFHLTKSNFYLISAGRLANVKNTRKELSAKCWPNVLIENMTVIVEDDAKEMDIFRATKDIGFSSEIGYLSKVSIKGMVFNYTMRRKPISFSVSNEDVNTQNTLKIQIDGVNLSAPGYDSSGRMEIRMNKGLERNSVSIKRSRISNQSVLGK